MDFLKTVPKWVLIAIVGYVAILFTFAIFDGRRVDFWPPAIHERTSSADQDLAQEIANLKKELSEKKSYISSEETLQMFPETVRSNTIQQTADRVIELVENVSKQKTELAALQEKMKGIESLEGDFLFRILTFHHEALCFGDSLNFTHEPLGLGAAKCTTKEKLAKRFLGFLAEIEFYQGPIVESPEIAKTELTNYQESKSFGRTGWYGRDVFKWIVIDYYGKA